MTVEELLADRSKIEEQYNNLSNPAWVSGELKRLQGMYDHATQLINKETPNATSPTEQKPATYSNVNQGKQAVSRKTAR